MADSLNDTLPTYIHTLMFAPNVEALCTEEQRRYWLPRCESMEVCVCVCATELFSALSCRTSTSTHRKNNRPGDYHAFCSRPAARRRVYVRFCPAACRGRAA